MLEKKEVSCLFVSEAGTSKEAGIVEETHSKLRAHSRW
jgi:hypothetical protein